LFKTVDVWRTAHYPVAAKGGGRSAWSQLLSLVVISGLLVVGIGILTTKSVNAQTRNHYLVPADAIFVAPTGNDAAVGSETAPLRTLGQALKKVGANGTIVLRAGTYREGINSVTRPVVIEPYQDEQVWIKGSDVVSSWSQQGNVWLANHWTSPFCQHCYSAKAIDPAHPLAGKPDQVFINDVPQIQVGTLAEVGAGKFFIDPSTLRLYIGSNPTGATVEVSSRWKALQLNAGAEGSIIRGIGFSEFAPHWNEDQLGMVIINASNVTLENNIFTRSAGTALMLAKPRATVTNNTIVENGYRGINANRADNSLIRGNKVDNNNIEHFAISSCSSVCTVAGFKAAHVKNLTVSNNSFSNNDGTGFWCDLGCTNTTISGNTVASNTNNGLFYEVSSHATISNNTITDNGKGLKIAGSDNVSIENNTFVANRTQIGMYDDPRTPATADAYSANLGLSWNTTSTKIVNNRFDGTAKTTLLLDSNRTSQIKSPQMVRLAQGNTVSGNQKFTWCVKACTTFSSLASFSATSGLSFGSVA
jgi:parallel beta-helix repeat protein